MPFVLRQNGFQELTATLARETTHVGMAHAHVQFVLDNPVSFTLMFRNDALDRTRPDYIASSVQVLAALERAAVKDAAHRAP